MFTFKFNEASMKGVQDNVRKAFLEATKSEPMLGEIGQAIVEDVVMQTKAGKSIPLKSDFKLLKESWIVYKKFLSTANKTDADYEEGRSNLTFTGQLLKSFGWTIAGPGKLILSFVGFHKPYKTGTGRESGEEIPNQTLAKYVADSGRPFVGVRPAMRLRVNRIVKTYVKRILVVARLWDGKN